MSKRTKSRTIKTYKYIGKHGAYNIYFVNGKPVIGVDIGYGNVKTHNFIIKNGVESYDSKPPFAKNVVEYDNKYFVIGEGRKPYNMDRTVDEDSFILVLAAIAMELENIGITKTEVILVSGLPLKWFARDKDKFKDYLSRAKHVTYKFNDKAYDITIYDIALYPQGLSGIISDIKDSKGSHMMVDIGNATMNVVRISNGVYSSNDIFTDLLPIWSQYT